MILGGLLKILIQVIFIVFLSQFALGQSSYQDYLQTLQNEQPQFKESPPAVTKPVQADFTAMGYSRVVGGDVFDMSTKQIGVDKGYVAAVDKFVTLSEGSFSDLKNLMDLIAKHTGPKLVITLGVGFEPPRGTLDTGYRAASALAKYLALNPELIDSLSKRGVNFLAYDKHSKKHFSSLVDFFASDSWRNINKQMMNAGREMYSDQFTETEKRLAKLKSQKQTPAVISEIAELEGKIKKVLGKAYASQVVNTVALESGTAGKGFGNAELLVKQANKVATAEASVRTSRSSGTKFNAAEAAARAAKGVK